MDLLYSLNLLEDKDTSVALKALEKLSETSDALYPHIDTFIFVAAEIPQEAGTQMN